MGLTERLARGCAARPRLTLALWGAAVLVALALVATSLHGLSSQGNVEGNPESTKAKDTIARAFPGVVASEQQDVIVVTSSRYTVDSPQFRAFARRLRRRFVRPGEVRGRAAGRRLARRPLGPRLRAHRQRLGRRPCRAGRGEGERRRVQGRHHRLPLDRLRLREAVADGPREGRARLRSARPRLSSSCSFSGPSSPGSCRC